MIVDTKPLDSAQINKADLVKAFSIKASAESFQILSDSLYSNKIRAILRELGTNAYDSHVLAGKGDVPFDVHLPSLLEPYFYIKDYGVGLDHDEVENILTIYFQSTKTDSNDFVGALGLGSKSPFAYTKNFSVIAIKDGIKRIYTAFVNDEGVPAVAQLAEIPTDESSGVEIKFAVNQNDFYSFKSEATTVYKWFSIHPNILNCPDFEKGVISYEKKDIIPGVHLLKGYGTPVAVMGNICYPISIPASVGMDKINLLNYKLLFHFEIGELDFQASREGLRYTKKTITALKNKIKCLSDSVYTVFCNDVDLIEDTWKRANFIYEKWNSMWKDSIIRYINHKNMPLLYISGGSLYFKSFQVNALDENLNIEFMYYTTDYRKHIVRKVLSSEYDNGIKYHQINAGRDIIFIVQDSPKYKDQNVRNYIKTNKIGNDVYYYILKKIDNDKDMDVDTFFANLYHSSKENIIKTSELLDVAKNPKVVKSVKDISIMQFISNRWYHYGKLDKFSDTETYFYLPLSNYKVLYNYENFSGNELLTKFIQSGLHDKVEVFGVRRSDISIVENCSNWINFEDYVREKVFDISDEFIDDWTSLAIAIPWYINSTILSNVTDTNSPFLRAKKVLYDAKTISKKYDDKVVNIEVVSELRSKFSGDNTIAEVISEKECIITKIKNTYPLLECLTRWVNTNNVVEYINLIDKK